MSSSCFQIPRDSADDCISRIDVEEQLSITAESGGSATVLVTPVGSSMSLDVSLADGAIVHLVLLSTLHNDVEITYVAHLADGAHLRTTNITLGSGNTTHSVQSTLTGADAVSDIDWVFYASNAQKHSIQAHNIFEGRAGGGQITMRGIAEDAAHVVCDGMINIGTGGGQTDTYLTEEVLMLDPTAKVDAIPGLEIKTNDVKASHSATVSRVTDEDLFYFASRGIQPSVARQMYIEGFVGSITATLPEEIAEEVGAAIAARQL